MPEFPRREMEEMVERWLAANAEARATANWALLAPFYTPDAVYTYDIGPLHRLVARGIDRIKETALGADMMGFDNWSFPYLATVIDHVKGEVMARWTNRGPGKRPDGTFYECMGSSWFRYAGNYQWSEQIDLFDLSHVIAVVDELGDEVLEPLRLKMDMVRPLLIEKLERKPPSIDLAEILGR
ncbi:MAG: nuclear transport factor 2 family protein [bacterium]|mgnify:CR=1 FL=1